MRYLNESHLNEIGIDWSKTVQVIAEAAQALGAGDYAQPIKPYLRYRNPKNRIIAMPGFVGGAINSAGIKWIASFPENIDKGLVRASSVLILNEVDTGIPEAIINGGLLSAIRTASVSGLLVREFQKVRRLSKVVVGMTGFGPIGQNHLAMVHGLLGDAIDSVLVYDLRPVNLDKVPAALRSKVRVVGSWQAAYDSADIFMTCTVSTDRYIDRDPKPGSLQLNVSLRDFQPQVLKKVDVHVVDSWEEICRENTDIELAHKVNGLQKSDTLSIDAFLAQGGFEAISPTATVMFNPMGMAIFDMAIARHFLTEARRKNVGIPLEA